MILTVTANTTIDQTLFVPSFERDLTIRATSTMISMGGKPTDASYILGEMGIHSHAIGFAAGALGEKAAAILRSKGATTEFVQAGGETRLNTVIVYESFAGDDKHGQTTITTNTLEVNDTHVEELSRLYESLLDRTTAIVIGGTLPQGMEAAFYTDFIGRAVARNIPVIFDCDEPNLRAGLSARPTYIKPNHHELGRLVGFSINTVQEAYSAGRYIVNTFGTIPVITLAEQGGLAVLPDKAYFIPPLPINVVSAGGAGDGVLAGLAAAAHRRQPIEEGLRLGFACAAAVCLMPGTADCRREDVERFIAQVELRAYP